MTPRLRALAALGALGAILAVTASWWALALWPLETGAPDWVVRTRLVCFGSTATGLPNAGGWLLLVGQPAGMLAMLVAVWRDELGEGLRLAVSRVAGQVSVGLVAGALVAGAGGVAVRVTDANAATFSTGAAELAARLTRVDDAAPAFSLVDQHGRAVTLDTFKGRPLVVTFAYAHCETVCPLSVSDVLAARRALVERARDVGVTGQPPLATVIITLDPWRDTPARLASMAAAWGLPDDALVLSGPPADVERVLNAWRIPRARNERTGEISHPPLVYVVDDRGRIAFAVAGNPQIIAAAVRAL